MRTTGDYKGSHEEVKHMQETLSLMSIMTQDHRFETVLSENSESGRKEIKTMCDVLDRIEEKGIAEGIAEGELRKAKEMAVSLEKQGVSVKVIATAAGVAEEIVRKWLGFQAV